MAPFGQVYRLKGGVKQRFIRIAPELAVLGLFLGHAAPFHRISPLGPLQTLRAGRLRHAAPAPPHANTLAGQAMRRAVRAALLREIDRARVKGKDEPTAADQPLGLEARRDRATGGTQARDLGSQCLGRAELRPAGVICVNLRRRDPGTPLYSFCSGRLARYRAKPPQPAWASVTTFDTK